MNVQMKKWMQEMRIMAHAVPERGALEAADDAALIDLIALTESLKGTLAALQAGAEKAFRDSHLRRQRESGVPREHLGRGIADQVALARRISPKQAGDQMALRRVLLESLPRTTALLARGEISEWAAHEVAKNVLVLDDEDRTHIDDDLADQLPTMSARQAGRTARARAQELDPAAAVERARKKISERRVSLRPAPDGMAVLSALLPQKEGVAAYAALHREARSRRSQGDQRGNGQIMADTLVERTTGAATVDDIPVEIQLLMTDSTLLSGGEETAWLNDHPVPAAVARDIALGVRGQSIERGTLDQAAQARAADPIQRSDPAQRSGRAQRSDPAPPAAPGQQTSAPELTDAPRWIRRLYRDPVSDELAAVDPRRRLFTGHVRRFILLRDQRCRTPWCDAPIRDIDHAHRSADGGLTTADNGVGHCQQFNLARETPGWDSRIVPADGATPSTLVITTPTGHTYRSPAPRLRPRRKAPSAQPATALPRLKPQGAEPSGADSPDLDPPALDPPALDPPALDPPALEPPERELMLRRPTIEGGLQPLKPARAALAPRAASTPRAASG
jgi:hypothetical protein